MNFHAKMAMSDSQRYPWNRYLSNNVEEIVVFLGLKCLILIIQKCFPTVEKPQSKIISFQNYQHWYPGHTWSDKAFQGTLNLNRATPSLHGGSHEITLSIPFRQEKKYSQHCKLIEPQKAVNHIFGGIRFIWKNNYTSW